MGLPVVALPRTSVDVAGEKVEVRSLSRAEVLRLSKLQGDPDAFEVFLLACATGYSEDEIRAWRETAPNEVVDPILEAAVELSGLTEGAQKSDS